jgi:hypothetical protein
MRRIPPEVLRESSRLFWDVEPATIDPVTHADFVLGRVLSLGSRGAVRALRTEVGDEALRDFVRRAPYRLDRRSLRFFQLVLGLEESSCTTTPFRRSSDRLFAP